MLAIPLQRKESRSNFLKRQIAGSEDLLISYLNELKKSLSSDNLILSTQT